MSSVLATYHVASVTKKPKAWVRRRAGCCLSEDWAGL
jgi:hypothetical protein